MTADFIPFVPSVAPAAGSNTPSGSFETAICSKPPGTPKQTAGPSPNASVQVEVKKDGDRITQIRVTCRCGERIEIDCQY